MADEPPDEATDMLLTPVDEYWSASLPGSHGGVATPTTPTPLPHQHSRLRDSLNAVPPPTVIHLNPFPPKPHPNHKNEHEHYPNGHHHHHHLTPARSPSPTIVSSPHSDGTRARDNKRAGRYFLPFPGYPLWTSYPSFYFLSTM